MSRHKLLPKSIPESFTVCRAVGTRQQGLGAAGHTALEVRKKAVMHSGTRHAFSFVCYPGPGVGKDADIL